MNDLQPWDIITGDCVTELARLKKRAVLAFADPPYNLGLDYGDTTDDRRPRPEFIQWCRNWMSECYINLQDFGSMWLLINHENAADLEIASRDIGFTVANYITWYESFGVNCKNKFTRSSRRLFHCVKDVDHYIFNREAVTRPSARQTVYHDKRANPEGRLWDDVWGVHEAIPRLCGTHQERLPGFPTQLPVKLLLPVVGCASNPGDLVIDLFSGSATTGVACLRLRRKYIGIEIAPPYAERSRQRLAAYHPE